MVSEVDKIEQHSIVTIGFENYGVRDETQLTVHQSVNENWARRIRQFVSFFVKKIWSEKQFGY